MRSRGDDLKARLLAVLGLCLLMGLIGLALQQLGMPETLAPGALADWLNGRGPWGPMLLMLLMVLAVVVGPVPTLPVSAASGLAFGVVGGTLVAVAGASMGAMLAFMTSRIVARDYCRGKLGDHPVFSAGASQRMLFWGVLVTRLVPVFSFALISYAAGLTAIRAGRFFWASAIGMLPMTIVFAGLGHSLALHPLWTVASALVLLSIMLLLPLYLQRRHGARFARWTVAERASNGSRDEG